MKRSSISIKDQIVEAALATDIPEGRAGLWYVRKLRLSAETDGYRNNGHRKVTIPAGCWTFLERWTNATMDSAEPCLGECVMHDTPDEIGTHLEFMLGARGRVLITGLGLGCVTRGCLANPAVKSVTVIERDRDVLKLVAPYMPQDKRLNIVRDDALRWARRSRSVFDCAWHDLWSDPDKREPHLQVTHQKLFCALIGRVRVQGAWQFPRMFRRAMACHGVI